MHIYLPVYDVSYHSRGFIQTPYGDLQYETRSKFRGATSYCMLTRIYQSSFDSSLSEFAELQNARLLEQIQSLQSLSDERLPNSEQAVSRRIDRLNRIRRAWSNSILDNPTEEDLHFKRLLESGFEEFTKRFFQQRETLEHGDFVQSVKLALPKLQAVRHMSICDEDGDLPVHSRRGSQISSDVGSLDDEQLFESLSRWEPMSYEDEEYIDLTGDATFLIPSLLAGFDTMNFRQLYSLDIEISKSLCLVELGVPSLKYDSKIEAAMQNLKAFRFIHRGPVSPRKINHIEGLRDFLGSIIVAESLECLHIETNLWNDKESTLGPDQLPLVSLIKARVDWPKLSSVLLDTLHIEHSDLMHLLRCVDSARRGYVGLRKIHLMDGSWATILDLLRERHSWANLASPSGAECEAMSLEEYERIFGPYSPIDNRTQEEEVSPGPTEAESYIRGWQDNNPLNVPPELNQD